MWLLLGRMGFPGRYSFVALTFTAICQHMLRGCDGCRGPKA